MSTRATILYGEGYHVFYELAEDGYPVEFEVEPECPAAVLLLTADGLADIRCAPRWRRAWTLPGEWRPSCHLCDDGSERHETDVGAYHAVWTFEEGTQLFPCRR